MSSVRIYHALVTSPTSTLKYVLGFGHTPGLRVLLNRLHELVTTCQPDAQEITVNTMRQLHVSGQEEQEFNESEVFSHSLGKSKLRIYLPELVNPPKD